MFGKLAAIVAGMWVLTPVRAAVPGQLDSHPAVFSVLAAINASGYDAELQSPWNHPVRLAVRKYLAGKQIPVLDELKRFYRDHRQDSDVRSFSLYLSFALCVDGPPNFKYRLRQNEIPPEVLALGELPALMKRFHQEAGIDEIYKQAQPAIDQAIASYHEPVSRAILEANGYLRNPTSGFLGRRFQIYLDLLGAPNQVQTRVYGDEFFIILTPSPEPQIDHVRHAYLQYLIDPLTLKYHEAIDKKKGLGDFAQPAPALDAAYKADFGLLTQKSLVKAVEARLQTGPGASARREQMVSQALAEGYILTPYFAEALLAYEKQEQAMRLYFPEMINAINLKNEDKRLEGVKFADRPFARTIKPPPAPAVAEPSGVEKSLNAAEDLIRDRKLAEARKTLLDVLSNTDNRPLQSKAYYGLARIAARENDPELAERLFRKSLELGPDPVVKAWDLVYLGRLSDIAGEERQAVENYKAAMAVEGISDGARKMAEQGLKGDFRRKPQ